MQRKSVCREVCTTYAKSGGIGEISIAIIKSREMRMRKEALITSIIFRGTPRTAILGAIKGIQATLVTLSGNGAPSWMCRNDFSEARGVEEALASCSTVVQL